MLAEIKRTALKCMQAVTVQVVVMIHSGSRGLGHQVATDALTAMERAMARDGVQTNDRQLACARIGSAVRCMSRFCEGNDGVGRAQCHSLLSTGQEYLWGHASCTFAPGCRVCVSSYTHPAWTNICSIVSVSCNVLQEAQDYLVAMACAANYAWVNRSAMTFLARQAFAKQFGQSPDQLDMHVVYDVSHNIAKVGIMHCKLACISFPALLPLKDKRMVMVLAIFDRR